MNLFKELVISAPVSSRLQFGYNDNIIVSAVDITVRKSKGIPIKANTFITLSQVDPETRKVVAQNEFNFWNLDPVSDFVEANFVEQMTALVSVVEAMGGDITAYESAIMSVLVDEKQLSDMVKTKDGAKALQDVLQNGFYESVKDFIGSECPLLKCKLIVNKSGYLEISKVQGWILPMASEDSLPEITPHEVKVRATAGSTSTAQAKPDVLGSAKPEGTVPVAAPEKVISSAGFSGL